MNVWGSMGNYVDGWAKFGVAVAALGWFGLQVADRYAPTSATVTIGRPEPAGALEEPPSSQPADGVELLPAAGSVVAELVRELALAASLLAANSFAQLAAVLAVGVTGGLAIRPKVNQWRDARAVKAARRRADRHAADLRLLAAHDARGNVPGPSAGAVQPLKRH